MIRQLAGLACPIGWLKPCFGGDDGGGEDPGIAHMQAEEVRKNRLRRKLNSFFGIDSGEHATVDHEKFAIPGSDYVEVFPATYIEDGGEGGGSRRMITPEKTESRRRYDESAYQAAVEEAKKVGDPIAATARAELAKQEAEIEKASRDHYTEELKHSYDKAERANRFALADRGLLGGSAQIDTEAELNRDNTRAATRMEDEIRGAVTNLRNSREGERLQATNLINSGAGEDAVASAQAGLGRAFDNASLTRKVNLTSDLFTGLADQVSAGNSGAIGPLAYQQYLQSLRKFSNPVSEVGGRVTATG